MRFNKTTLSYCALPLVLSLFLPHNSFVLAINQATVTQPLAQQLQQVPAKNHNQQRKKPHQSKHYLPKSQHPAPTHKTVKQDHKPKRTTPHPAVLPKHPYQKHHRVAKLPRYKHPIAKYQRPRAIHLYRPIPPTWYPQAKLNPDLNQTLKNVVVMTIKTNPTVLQTVDTAHASREQIAISRAGYLPKLDVTMGIGKERTLQPSLGADDVLLTRKEIQFSASQLLWDGWGTLNQIRSSKYQFQANVFQAAEQRQLTALRATEVYLDILHYYRLVNIAKINVENHRVTLHKVNLRFKGGAGNKADVNLAKDRLAQANATLYTSQGLLMNSNAAFLNVVGIKARNLRMPVLPQIPATLENAIIIAYANSPAIKVAKKSLAAACANLRVAKASFWPTFSLEGFVSRDSNIEGIVGPDNSARGMVMMRYNLVNGGADVAAVRQAVFNYENAQHALVEAKRTVRENVTTAWNNVYISRQRVTQLAARINYTKQVLIAYRKQFELGQRSLLNLVDIQRELFNAESEFLDSLFAVASNTYGLFASMGRLVEKFC